MPSANTMLFYVVGIAAAGLLARHRSRLTGFEQLALLVMLLAGVSAIRSIVWFALAALILLPRLLDGALSQWSRGLGRIPKRVLASAALGALLVATCVVVAQPPAWSARDWPETAAEQVAEIAAARPEATVFADARYADWLLWEQPQLSRTNRLRHPLRALRPATIRAARRLPEPHRRRLAARDRPPRRAGRRPIWAAGAWFVHSAPARPTTSPTGTTRSPFSPAAGSGPSDALVTVVAWTSSACCRPTR